MNGYVAGGWGATAGMLALYTWRVLYRGRVLRRTLPAESPPAEILGAQSDPAQSGPAQAPSPALRSAQASSGFRDSAAGEVRTWP